MEVLNYFEAKNKRTQIKASATRLKTFADNYNVEQGTRHDITERKTRLIELWAQFDAVQSRIETLENEDASIINKDALLAQQIQHRTSFEESYFSLLSRYNAVLEFYDLQQNPPVAPPQGVAFVAANRESRVRLPKIELPMFTGSYDDWYSYQDTFEKLIHDNTELSEIEKFHYLRSSLKDKAAQIIKSIETTSDNYREAWTAVKERFDNKRWIMQKHIRAIFEAPVLNKENHVNLRELLDTILKHLRALKAIKRPTDHWDDLIIHIIVSKLDPATSKAWETSIPDKEIPTLKSLTEFLSKRCQALEAIFSKLSINHSNTLKSSKSRFSAVANTATSNLSCSQCKENHSLYHCEAFLKLPIEKRIQVVKGAHLCMNCLRSSSHQAKACNSSVCRKCSKKHNTLLHLSNSIDDNKVSNRAPQSEANNAVAPIATQCSSVQGSLGVILSTAIIHVYDSSNQIHSCRALLDSGSQINFITQGLADKLHLKRRSVNMAFFGVAQGALQANDMITTRIKSRFNRFSANIDCLIVPRITQQLPQNFISTRNIVIPSNIKLADPNFNVPSNIDILIGAELFWRLICTGQIRASRAQPTLQKTYLGWIISGPTTNKMPNLHSPLASCLAVADDLNRSISRFWEVEHLAPVYETSPEEQTCERIFQETVRRNDEGRFIVQLPINSDKLSQLGDSEEIATRRFRALEKRLMNSHKIYAEYKQFIQEYIELGHMREVDGLEKPIGSCYYLPHHAVYKETSTTTKLRVVFDASCKTTTGISLNDALLVGPTIQDDLFSILARFRIFRYALTADITKMYRQVLIDPSQTSLQRILWRDSTKESIRTFELLTVTYGTASAAFLAIRSLRKLAKDNHTKYPIGARVVLNDFYVDDMVTGADTLQDAMAIKQQTTQLLQEGLFELCKWASNVPSLQDRRDTSPQKEFMLSSDKQDETRTLGLIWNCISDQFKFSSIACLPPLTSPTKRGILSRVALVFDPLGLLGPSTIIAKIIIQDLWRLKSDWDESLSLEMDTKWKRYEYELPALRNTIIPRRVVALDGHNKLELHGFADASEVAYGACIYLRATDSNGTHATRLLCSKNRVAPLKSLSIPRLELCAALLLARLANKVINSLNHRIKSAYFWTDSTIVLAWLQSCSRSWTTFVANRVGEIQQLTATQNWHHVSSQDNPADLLSRGVMPAALPQSQLWWSGPPWLDLDEEKWARRSCPIDKKDLPERKATAIVMLNTKESSFNIFDRFSKLMKLLRVIAYIYRFYNRLKHKIKPSGTVHVHHLQQPITADELQHATQIIVRMIQKAYFAKELASLLAHQFINKNSPLLRLNPFLDEDGILRVGGRLKLSHIPYNAKHPMLLPGHHVFSRLIIIYEHERHFHAGPLATLSAIRQNYWLVSARNIVRQIIHKCIVCFRSSPTSASTLMGNLPEARISIPKRPFEKCGIDYAGPFYYKDGSRRAPKLLKCYLAIFVCFATTAVHIELAADLSAEAFLNVLKRFIARRGNPSDIFSDNGLNFVGAERELHDLATMLKDQETQSKITSYATANKIKWHFIPPRAPHHGGLWEAAVKGAKRHLLRVTKHAHLKYEQLSTLLTQVEAILNSRPLTPISTDPNDITSLTPGHFLIGSSLTSYPEPSLEEVPINRLSYWQRVEQLHQHFWRRWSQEYLHHCQQRSKWRIKERSVHVGQIVLLKEDNAPPLTWPLAKIIELHSGNDGIIRTLTVRTNKGTYKRPITRLCLLPFEDD